jgi:predicted amidophosphoribosyltransferase
LARHECAFSLHDRRVDLIQSALAVVAPPLCACCGRGCRPEAVLCNRCARRLASAEPLLGQGPPGTDRAWSSAPHEGVARNLVSALKFRHLLPVAELMADRIHWLCPAHMLSGAIVPVPPAAPRLRRRGFDPAGELAATLAARLDIALEPCLARRGGDHQVGRRRADRIGRPPRIHTVGKPPPSVLLIDDVLTTGATLSSAAQALRAAGAKRIVAVTFTRRL